MEQDDVKQDDVEQAIFQYFSRKICSKLAVPLTSPVFLYFIKNQIVPNKVMYKHY